MRTCKTCGIDISDRGNRSFRCGYCQAEKTRERDRIRWAKRKYKYANRWMTRLGNPQQDDEVLEFLRNKREGKTIPKHSALKDSAFKYKNEAEYQRDRKNKKVRKR